MIQTRSPRVSLLTWLERRGGTVSHYAFPSRIDHAGYMSTRQYARLVDEWVDAVGLRRAEYGTHSLRHTKASMIYKGTGNLRAIQILLGHTKIENTVRYLGADIEDALTLAERTEIRRAGRPISSEDRPLRCLAAMRPRFVILGRMKPS